MKILIVNDDSIHAPGIAALAKAAAQLGEVWVVAPMEQCSAMSQKLTLRDPLPLKQVTDFPAEVKSAWMVGGTPVDCVKVALYCILKEKPDFVFSGINNGYNAGFDIAYSGTLGAAFEAARNGIPAIAFSSAGDSHLEALEKYLLPVIEELIKAEQEPGTVWNVNFPAARTRGIKGILRDRIPAPVSMYTEVYEPTVLSDGSVELMTRGIPVSDAQIPEGTDARAVRDGYISIGKVRAF